MSDETPETPYEPDHPDSRYDNTGQRQKQRYTETITAGEEGTTTSASEPVEADGATPIDPDGNVQAPLEDDGA